MAPEPGEGSLFDDPGELIAAVPALLTFTPTDSLVLVFYRDHGDRHLLAGALRMDFPAPHRVDEVVDQLCAAVANHDGSVAYLAVLGGRPAAPPDHLPQRTFVEQLITIFGRQGILVRHAVWTPHVDAEETWWCYEDPGCTGQVRDPATSLITVAATLSGKVTFANRAEVLALLDPDHPDQLARRAELLATLPPVDAEGELAFLSSTIDRIGTSTVSDVLDEPTILRAAHALSHRPIQGACFGFALTEHIEPAERLWIALTRAMPSPARAHPAIQLAVSCFLHGNGVLAGAALDVALEAQPDHYFAQVLRGAMSTGLRPDVLRAMLVTVLRNRAVPPVCTRTDDDA